MQTTRQRHGTAGEAIASAYISGLGWACVARNVRVGRDEIDLLCVDPGPPAALVSVEVRSVQTDAFGAPEERVDRLKVGRLYRSLNALGSSGQLDSRLTRLPRRVDLVVIDRRFGRTEVRHLRELQPP
jgi:Holliday junction resolvase-like predicted endonuclease